ncbi:MAG: acyl transferase, partial [Chitinophagaceae bacterium]
MGFELPKAKNLEKRLFGITNEKEFEQIALEVFRFQYLTNGLYQSFCDALGRKADAVQRLTDIPFLPIQFFKSQEVKSGDFKPAIGFSSSGTTGSQTSRHYVKELPLYEKSFLTCFEKFYGQVDRHCVLGLLPSYLERQGSSLIYMVDELISQSRHPQSGFYLYDHEKLAATLASLEKSGQRTILFGVSYALLDF